MLPWNMERYKSKRLNYQAVGLIFASFLNCEVSAQAHLHSTKYLVWNRQQPLTADDFWAVPDETDSQVQGMTASKIRFSAKLDSTTHVYHFNVVAVFDRSKSWLRYKGSAALLEHEQGHFDLTQIFANRLDSLCESRAFTEYQYGEAKAIYQRIIQDLARVQSDYDQETTYPEFNRIAQNRWTHYFNHLLR